ncbi:MAG TPA: hemerythrin domain-containing protein [Candidatus Binatia bacterium]|nr:hemerythrin domain-containing protein [Candidatus Binatia bacterium]
MDALELLKQDHAKVKKLFDKAESVDNREQKRIFNQIKIELEIHAQIEENIFYPAMQRYDGLKELVAESLKEHGSMKALLQKLVTLTDPEEFKDTLEELIDSVEHHAEDEEEGKMFPKVRELVSANELQKLGAQLQAAKGHRKAS